MKKIALHVVEVGNPIQNIFNAPDTPGWSPNPLTTPLGILATGFAPTNPFENDPHQHLRAHFHANIMDGQFARPAPLYLAKDGQFVLDMNHPNIALDTMGNLAKLVGSGYGEEVEILVQRGPITNLSMAISPGANIVLQATFHCQQGRPVAFEKRDDKWCVWNRRDNNWLEVNFKFDVPGSFSLNLAGRDHHLMVEACGQNIGVTIDGSGKIINVGGIDSWESEQFTEFMLQDTNKLLEYIVTPPEPKTGEYLAGTDTGGILRATRPGGYIG